MGLQQEEATTAECERNSSLDTVLHTDCEYDEDSTSWNEIIENLPLTDSDAEWVSALQKIAERDFLPFPVQSAHITVERSIELIDCLIQLCTLQAYIIRTLATINNLLTSPLYR